ncbi:hypothetical protein M8J77_014539 [Diaphorina citri]|nr:hypothetical protein M8J77_014539 [Diaphorina citri]
MIGQNSNALKELFNRLSKKKKRKEKVKNKNEKKKGKEKKRKKEKTAEVVPYKLTKGHKEEEVSKADNEEELSTLNFNENKSQDEKNDMILRRNLVLRNT